MQKEAEVWPEETLSNNPFAVSSSAIELKPAPIKPGWIRKGTPVARFSELSRSKDQTASTFVWDCTAGQFEWTFDCDETVYIVEGSVVVRGGLSAA